MFDWQRFMERHNLDFTERGPSTAKGNLYVKCPFCGEADQGRHMGVSLSGRGWGCWKDARHRGKAPHRLIQALLGCSAQEAARLAGAKGRGLLGPDMGFLGAVWGALGGIGTDGGERPLLRLPEAFRPLSDSPGPHAEYLRGRGWGRGQIKALAARYNLRAPMGGGWGYRVVLPVLDMESRLVTWTGRAIHPDAQPKYKTLTSDPEKAGTGPLAEGAITDYLLSLPELKQGGSFLVCCEGPFDAMNLSLYTKEFGAEVTCLFGKVVSFAQMDLLAVLRPLYKSVFLLLDPDAAMGALRIASQLAYLGVVPIYSEGEWDPGELPDKEARKMLEKMARATGKR